jgi:hypothetical protein
VLVSRVPTVSGAIVRRIALLLYTTGFPLDTQFAFELSPRYFEISTTSSRVVSLKSFVLHTGAGVQDCSV